MNHTNELPVAVIGAGPVGLAAAAHLVSRGLPLLVFEAGDGVGASIRQWGHVRVFSPWEFNLDPVARELLEQHGWTAPELDGYPTGDQIVERYLEPLAAVPPIAGTVRLNARVLGVIRAGIDKLKDAGRDDAPFELVLDEPGGERRYLARAVIDVSGTWTRPNPLAAGGLPAAGERVLRERIAYGIPDVLGVDLIALRESEPATQIVWAIRGGAPGRVHGGGGADRLPARGRLGAAVRSLVEDGSVAMATGFHTRRVSPHGDRIVLSDDDREIVARACTWSG
jgi:glycine/D-amino acid oxidase-like deaminating enzyme